MKGYKAEEVKKGASDQYNREVICKAVNMMNSRDTDSQKLTLYQGLTESFLISIGKRHREKDKRHSGDKPIVGSYFERYFDNGISESLSQCP